MSPEPGSQINKPYSNMFAMASSSVKIITKYAILKKFECFGFLTSNVWILQI